MVPLLFEARPLIRPRCGHLLPLGEGSAFSMPPIADRPSPGYTLSTGSSKEPVKGGLYERQDPPDAA